MAMSKVLRCSVIGVMLAGATAVHARTVQPSVAQATMVIGQVQVIHADGSASAMARGFDVHVGDTVQTALGGHVHLRFVDGARVSVRPSSRLQIDSYSYSQTDTQASGIKFKLEEGVVRSITGEWGAAARDRFRLNTPVAAIGVKGTDFLVKATPDLTSATVFTGAISVAPLQGACGAGLGSCQEGRLLSEDMKGQMVQLGRLQTAPSLVTSTGLAVASLPQQAVKQAVTQAEEQPQKIGAAVLLPAQPVLATLGWGRHGWTQPLSGDDFSAQIDSAMLQASEQLSNNGAYALHRPLEAGKPVAHAPGAATSVAHKGGLAPVKAFAATLGVNFDARTSATRLGAESLQWGATSSRPLTPLSAPGRCARSVAPVSCKAV